MDDDIIETSQHYSKLAFLLQALFLQQNVILTLFLIN